MTREILLNAFHMNTVGHQAFGLWTHPRNRARDYNRLETWVELARTLERGLFDGLFLADVLGIYDVYGSSPDAALRHAVQVPVNDPLALVPAMAMATRHLGFGVTCTLSYEPPYTFARRMSTLDHLTDGRIGWNIVTGYLNSAALGMGQQGQTGHDRRYDMAEDYMAAVYKLPAGPDGHTYWRDVGTLDALRLAQLDFVHGSPARLPRAGAVTDWHLGQGSVAMMGAVVSHSADLRNTIVAPGCYVPPGLVAGHDSQEDAAWFTRTPGGTVLITQAMLDRRAVLRIPQSRMRVAPQFGHPHQVRSSLVKDQQHA